MKLLWRIIVLCCYVGLLFLLFSPVRDDVMLSFHSCQEINCSYALVELLETYPNHYCAFYDLEDDVLYEAINEGVLYDENYEEKYSKLQSVSSRGLMHHKFCVFEDQYVFTGSWNPTNRGTNYNDNYVLFIDSKKVAELYQDMYEHLKDREQEINSGTVLFTEGSIEVYACPFHDCQEQVLLELEDAKQSVKMLSFTFTDEPIAEQLLYLSRQGVDVDVVFEKTRITRYSAYQDLQDSDVDLYLDGNSYTMHEKMIIIDDEVAILGSYNPTKSATTKNDENVLIIRNEQVVAEALKEYERVLGEATS